MESLEAKVNGYLHGNARARAVNEACGPFHIGFDAGNANPFLNYAVPAAGAEVTPEDIDALLAAFAKRERTPRLEFAPGGAPGVEEALLARRDGYNIIFEAATLMPEYIANGLVVKDRFIQANSELVQQITKAMTDAARWVMENRASALRSRSAPTREVIDSSARIAGTL